VAVQVADHPLHREGGGDEGEDKTEDAPVIKPERRHNGPGLDTDREGVRDLLDQPNNKDPRHKPFRGLLADLVDAYTDGDKGRIANCTVEVATDLQEFSGKTNKEIASDLGIRLKNFQDIVEKLHKDGIERPSAGLIRKARIADDMGWRCPYTDPKGLRRFDCKDLQYRKLDKDHIIPRTRRQSDSLDSLVITYPEVNRLKGDRTGLLFVREFEGQDVKLDNGQTVAIASEKDYLAFVEKLAPEAKPNRFSRGAGHLDDKLRRWRRKQRLLIEKYTREDKDFTPGDLTATSHLSRMAAERIVRFFGWRGEPSWRKRPGASPRTRATGDCHCGRELLTRRTTIRSREPGTAPARRPTNAPESSSDSNPANSAIPSASASSPGTSDSPSSTPPSTSTPRSSPTTRFGNASRN